MPASPQQIPTEQSSPDWNGFQSILESIRSSSLGGVGNLAGGLESFFAMLASMSGNSTALEPYQMGDTPFLDSSLIPERIGANLGKAILGATQKKDKPIKGVVPGSSPLVKPSQWPDEGTRRPPAQQPGSPQQQSFLPSDAMSFRQDNPWYFGLG